MKIKNWPLYLILFSTVGPALLAMVLFQQSQQLDEHSLFAQGKQGGHFLSFPVTIPEQGSFNQQQWHLVKVTESCEQQCQSQVSRLYSILTALGKRRDKADLLLRSQQDFNTSQQQQLAEYSAFIATPDGQIILGYKPNQLDKTLLKDLKHLIKMNPILPQAKQG